MKPAAIREYWNDIEIEKSKPFWIQDKADDKLVNYIKEQTNILRCFDDALKFKVSLTGPIKGDILDIGSGTSWSSVLLSKIDSARSITAIDYSAHRLNKIAPIVFAQLEGDLSKFFPVAGDFMEIDFKDRKFQAVLFCQSLYMFPNLKSVLEKAAGLLSDGGILMVVAERIVPEYPDYSLDFFKKKIRRFLNKDVDLTGNHYYTDCEYQQAIKKAGLNYHFQLLDYPLFPKDNPALMAGNHFGIK